MTSAGLKPVARSGLVATDHSKRGKRFVTLLDPETHQVTLLEAWEHAVLLVSDGTRDLQAIHELLAPEVDGQAIDLEVLRRCLKYFEQKRLIHPIGLKSVEPPGPVTRNELHRAYAEWHKEPPGTTPAGLNDAGTEPPIPRSGVRLVPGLAPTIAAAKPGIVPSSGLLAVESLLLVPPPSDEAPALDVLAAVDLAVSEADREIEREKRRRAPGEVQEGESIPRDSQVVAALAISVEVAPELSAAAPPPAEKGRPKAAAPGGRAPARLSEVLALDATEPETTLSPAATAARQKNRRQLSEPTERLRDQAPKTELGTLVDDPKPR